MTLKEDNPVLIATSLHLDGDLQTVSCLAERRALTSTPDA